LTTQPIILSSFMLVNMSLRRWSQ